MRRTLSGSWRIVVGVLVIASGVFAVFVLPIDEAALGLVEWVRGAGAGGAVVYALVYIVATVFLLPGSVLTAGAGFAYGPVFGTLLVSPVSVLASTLAFILGRSVARGWVLHKIARDGRFAAVDQAVGESGFKIVLLLRLSPIFPFNLLNYALGLTCVRLRDYVLASWVGMLPGTLLYIYLGSLVTSASQLLSGKPAASGIWGQVVYWGGLVATVLVTVLVTRTARRGLHRVLGRTAVEPAPAAGDVHP